jgi:hypothetical protein
MTTHGCCPDEENWWGLCYKKCDVLTNGTHPSRCWPNACGITNEFTKCFDPKNIDWQGFGANGHGVDRDGGFAKVPCYTENLLNSGVCPILGSMMLFSLTLLLSVA